MKKQAQSQDLRWFGCGGRRIGSSDADPIIDSHIHLFDQTRPQGAPYSGGGRVGAKSRLCRRAIDGWRRRSVSSARSRSRRALG